MINAVAYKNTLIKYSDRGNGFPIVLLHGYLESREVWNEMEAILKNDFRIICIDLPGHGGTGVISKMQTMDDFADCVNEVIDDLQIEKSFVMGHSMGGYVALAFAEKYPEKVAGFSLFHSNPFADTDEKRENRNREIEIIRSGKKDLIFTNHFPKIFAPENVTKFKDEINTMKQRVENMPDQGIINSLEGMKLRADKTEFLSQYTKPFLYLLGANDSFISVDILEKITLPKLSEVKILKNSGHMGLIEEPEQSAGYVKDFIEKYIIQH